VSVATWSLENIDEYGTYVDPYYAHCMLYFARDVSRRWGAHAAEGEDWACVRLCVARAERIDRWLAQYTDCCGPCALCRPPVYVLYEPRFDDWDQDTARPS
jgi:hypothetical protein